MRQRAYDVLNHARQYVLNSDWNTLIALQANKTLKTSEYLLKLDEYKSRPCLVCGMKECVCIGEEWSNFYSTQG